MTITTRICSAIFGKKVGEDEFGNSYFTNKAGVKRWVIYNGKAEASKVPADWHRWLHKTTDIVPQTNKKTYKWEKQHLPNLSGGELTYVPKGHLKRGGKRDKTTGDYQAWKP